MNKVNQNLVKNVTDLNLSFLEEKKASFEKMIGLKTPEDFLNWAKSDFESYVDYKNKISELVIKDLNLGPVLTNINEEISKHTKAFESAVKTGFEMQKTILSLNENGFKFLNSNFSKTSK